MKGEEMEYNLPPKQGGKKTTSILRKNTPLTSLKRSLKCHLGFGKQGRKRREGEVHVQMVSKERKGEG